jgi:hypothetical protein
MSTALNNAMITQLGSAKSRPSTPGSPTYIGAVDYPDTVYQGYIGSTGYTYEPRATGYDIIDTSNIPFPVARIPKSQEFKELNLRTITAPVFGECSIPSFFQTSEDSLRSCNQKFAIFLFKTSLVINSITVLTMYTRVTFKFAIYFIFFHILLYYFLTRTFVNVSIAEWRTVQRYRYLVKKDIEIAINDSLTKQFNEINTYMKNENISRRRILEMTLVVSFLGIWIPLMILKERT